MQALRVLHVGKFYPPAPGGMERIVQLLCEGSQPEIENAVLVAATRLRTTKEVLHGVPVTRVGSMARIGSVAICPTFPLHYSRMARDLTVIHEPNPVALVCEWLAARRDPLVVWFHSEVLRPRWKYRLLYRPFLRRVLRRAHRIVVSSPPLAQYAAELRDFRDKCVVIPFGIDADRLKLTPEVAEKVSAVDPRFPGRRILFVGRLVPYKGLDVLIRAMTMVDATALVIGESPMRPALEQQAVDCGVGDKVRFLGRLADDEVVAHLHACDVFVLPSVTSAETFGVVQLEAMACGKPVVSTDLCTGVPWVNRHGETGLVVPPQDADALAAALNGLLADPWMRDRMGRSARQRVEGEFTAAHMRTRAAALYQQVAVECALERQVEKRAELAGSINTDASKP